MRIIIQDTVVSSYSMVYDDDREGICYRGTLGNHGRKLRFSGLIANLDEFQKWHLIGLDIDGKKLKQVTLESANGDFSNFELVDYEL